MSDLRERLLDDSFRYSKRPLSVSEQEVWHRTCVNAAERIALDKAEIERLRAENERLLDEVGLEQRLRERDKAMLLWAYRKGLHLPHILRNEDYFEGVYSDFLQDTTDAG